jgi:hypothetical protein
MALLQERNAPELRDDTLAGLPNLLSFARQVLIAKFPSGDVEADALRAQIEACVVDAHRLALRERMSAGARQTAGAE